MDAMLSRRSLAGLLGVLGLGALGVPVQEAAADQLPECTMRILLTFPGQPTVALNAAVVERHDRWQLEGRFTSGDAAAFAIPIAFTGASDIAQLLVTARRQVSS